MRTGIFMAMAVLMTAGPAAGRPTLVIDRTARASVFDDGTAVQMVVTGQCSGALAARLILKDSITGGNSTSIGPVGWCHEGPLEVRLDNLSWALVAAWDESVALELVVRVRASTGAFVAMPDGLRVDMSGLEDHWPDRTDSPPEDLLVPLEVRVDW